MQNHEINENKETITLNGVTYTIDRDTDPTTYLSVEEIAYIIENRIEHYEIK